MNHLTDYDPDTSCQSPHHNPDTCDICIERKNYADVLYCPDCCEYYRKDTGEVMPAPEYAECESVVCIVCGSVGGDL